VVAGFLEVFIKFCHDASTLIVDLLQSLGCFARGGQISLLACEEVSFQKSRENVTDGMGQGAAAGDKSVIAKIAVFRLLLKGPG
jgi:hypothetical protein